MNKMVTNTYLSTIILNADGLNALIKKHTVAKWLTKQDAFMCHLQDTHFRSKDTHRLKVQGWKNIFHKNENKKFKTWGSNIYTRQRL